MQKQKEKPTSARKKDQSTRKVHKKKENQKKRLREIRKLCANQQNCIPKSVIKKIVRQLIEDSVYAKELQKSFRVSKNALNTLHILAEDEATSVCHMANLLAMNRDQNTVTGKDIQLAGSIFKLGPNSVGTGWNMAKSEFETVCRNRKSKKPYKVIRPAIAKSFKGEEDKNWTMIPEEDNNDQK
jgi:histone H3/H4